MAIFELILLLLAAVLVSAVLDQFIPKVTSPLIQIALGLIIALFAKGYINIELDPNLFLVLVIAPLLYNDAREIDKQSLWVNRRPILASAVLLVILTALAVGAAIHALIPAIPLIAAIALAAALGPTDAVAVASLPKTINIGQREQSILEGESLLNDASGIVSFQFAVSIYLVGTFSFFDASVSFFISFFGGVLVGAVLGVLTNLISNGMREVGLESITFHVLFDVFTPFIVFLAANPFGASGVIAVVTAGLVSTVGKHRFDPSASRMNIVSSSVWRVFSFGLNGIVFVLLGTQLPKAMESTWESATFDNGFLIAMIIVITLAINLIRFLWLMGSEALHARRHQLPFSKETLRSALIMTLAGTKGTITLSIVLTLPLFTASGAIFPQRQLIIFLASSVILVSLLLANIAVPLLAGSKKVSVSDAQNSESEREAKVEILRNVIAGLAYHHKPGKYRATQAVIRSYNDRINRIKANETEEDPMKTELRLRALQWEREYIEQALDEDSVDKSDAFYVLHRILRQESLLKHSTISPLTSAKIRQAHSFAKALVHRVIKGLPLASISEHAASRHELMIKSARYANEKLRELLKDSGDIPTEYVSTLFIENTRTMASMTPRRPSITSMTAIAMDDATEEILRRGFTLEMEGIQEMLEAGRISRSTARRLRENVVLMQIDLEENI